LNAQKPKILLVPTQSLFPPTSPGICGPSLNDGEIETKVQNIIFPVLEAGVAPLHQYEMTGFFIRFNNGW